MSRRWARCCALIFACLPCAVQAQTGAAGEAPLKAAFVYNFSRLVEWPGPGDEGKSLHFCIAGGGPVARQLLELEGKIAQGRPLAVRTIKAAAEVKSCQLVFASGMDGPSVPDVLHAARGLPVLTVSDVNNFTEMGGVIGMLLVDDRVQFEINLASARENGLRISAHLLRLARAVRGGKL